jgi:hypothetical protein
VPAATIANPIQRPHTRPQRTATISWPNNYQRSVDVRETRGETHGREGDDEENSDGDEIAELHPSPRIEHETVDMESKNSPLKLLGVWFQVIHDLLVIYCENCAESTDKSEPDVVLC